MRSAAAAALVLGAAALLVALPRGAPQERHGVYAIEREGLRYEFHAVMGTETLWQCAAVPDGRRNLARARPDDVARLRSLLLRALRAASLEDLRTRHRASIEGMRHLGYL